MKMGRQVEGIDAIYFSGEGKAAWLAACVDSLMFARENARNY